MSVRRISTQESQGKDAQRLFQENLVNDFNQRLIHREPTKYNTWHMYAEGEFLAAVERFNEGKSSGEKIDWCQLAFDLCGANVGAGFIHSTCDMLRKGVKGTEMLYMTAKDMNEIQSKQDFDDNSLGFIIAERGEHKKRSRQYSVRLVCSPCAAGSVLMACFLFCLASQPFKPQEAILELAHSYMNTGAFCMYEKFGFTPDYDLLLPKEEDKDGSPLPFTSAWELPMSVNLDKVYGKGDVPKKILDILTTKGGRALEQSSDLCSYGKNDDRQVLCAMAHNMLYFLDVKRPEHIADTDQNYAEIKYQHLYDILAAKYSSGGASRHSVLSAYNRKWIEHFLEDELPNMSPATAKKYMSKPNQVFNRAKFAKRLGTAAKLDCGQTNPGAAQDGRATQARSHKKSSTSSSTKNLETKKMTRITEDKEDDMADEDEDNDHEHHEEHDKNAAPKGSHRSKRSSRVTNLLSHLLRDEAAEEQRQDILQQMDELDEKIVAAEDADDHKEASRLKQESQKLFAEGTKFMSKQIAKEENNESIKRSGEISPEPEDPPVLDDDFVFGFDFNEPDPVKESASSRSSSRKSSHDKMQMKLNDLIREGNTLERTRKMVSKKLTEAKESNNERDVKFFQKLLTENVQKIDKNTHAKESLAMQLDTESVTTEKGSSETMGLNHLFRPGKKTNTRKRSKANSASPQTPQERADGKYVISKRDYEMLQHCREQGITGKLTRNKVMKLLPEEDREKIKQFNKEHEGFTGVVVEMKKRGQTRKVKQMKVGTKRQVITGEAFETSTGLTKGDFKLNHKKQHVSRRSSAAAKESGNLAKSGYYCADAAARDADDIKASLDRFVAARRHPPTNRGKGSHAARDHDAEAAEAARLAVAKNKASAASKQKAGGSDFFSALTPGTSYLLPSSSSTMTSSKSRGGAPYGTSMLPTAYDGQGVGTSGVDLQFVAGNATGGRNRSRGRSLQRSRGMQRSRGRSLQRSRGMQRSRGRGRSYMGGSPYGAELLPTAYDGQGVGTSGVNLQFVAGNATGGSSRNRRRTVSRQRR